VLDLLRYSHELRSSDEVEAPPKSGKGAGVSEAEIKMALQLVDGMTGKWDPSKFKDEYRDDVMSLVKRKVKEGQTHTIVEPEPGEKERPARREVMDLMPLLKQSLAEHAGEAKRPAKKKSRAASAKKRPRKSA
jgi:DNA end-binding protein Ku